MVQDHFWKNTFLTHFPPIFAPKMAPFQGILGSSVVNTFFDACIQRPFGLVVMAFPWMALCGVRAMVADSCTARR